MLSEVRVLVIVINLGELTILRAILMDQGCELRKLLVIQLDEIVSDSGQVVTDLSVLTELCESVLVTVLSGLLHLHEVSLHAVKFIFVKLSHESSNLGEKLIICCFGLCEHGLISLLALTNDLTEVVCHGVDILIIKLGKEVSNRGHILVKGTSLHQHVAHRLVIRV